MKRCMNCGITSGIKDAHNFCHACGGIQFEMATNNKNQDLAKRVKTLEKKIATLEVVVQKSLEEQECLVAAYLEARKPESWDTIINN